MKFALAFVVLCVFVAISEAQFGFFRDLGNIFSRPFRGGNRFRDSGTQTPQANGNDENFPTDCGRNTNTGRGKLCFPVGNLCAERLNRQGMQNFGGKNYLLSWQDPRVAGVKWDWFNARNYCRKRCMDLVSIETEQEYNWLKGQMGGVAYFWTSGRLCDFDGCDRPQFQPKNINGWFWSANQARLAPTNSRNQFHDWSHTGGAGRPQPDNREGGESCMAVLNNFYGDGTKWHDIGCSHEKPIVCEDNPGHLQFARQNFRNVQIP